MKINTKEDIINYFQSGYKKSLLIGVENEKFLLEKDTSVRANYQQIIRFAEKRCIFLKFSPAEHLENLPPELQPVAAVEAVVRPCWILGSPPRRKGDPVEACLRLA